MDENTPVPDIGPTGSLIIMALAAALIIIPFWRIFSKAGYSGWLSLLMILPIINFITLYFLAFTDWPILRTKESHVEPFNRNPPSPPSTSI